MLNYTSSESISLYNFISPVSLLSQVMKQLMQIIANQQTVTLVPTTFVNKFENNNILDVGELTEDS